MLEIGSSTRQVTAFVACDNDAPRDEKQVYMPQPLCVEVHASTIRLHVLEDLFLDMAGALPAAELTDTSSYESEKHTNDTDLHSSGLFSRFLYAAAGAHRSLKLPEDFQHCATLPELNRCPPAAEPQRQRRCFRRTQWTSCVTWLQFEEVPGISPSFLLAALAPTQLAHSDCLKQCQYKRWFQITVPDNRANMSE